MQLRHISPGSIEWVDAMQDGDGGWGRLAPEERMKLRASDYSPASAREGEGGGDQEEDYRWGLEDPSTG
jgi:hypothetical protein